MPFLPLYLSLPFLLLSLPLPLPPPHPRPLHPLSLRPGLFTSAFSRARPSLFDSSIDITRLSLDTLRTLIRGGIPASLRPKIWYDILAISNLRSSYDRQYYHSLCATKVEAEVYKIIDKDIDRTFVTHSAFQNPNILSALRRILIAYAARKVEIGYCQSLNYIAGFLLLFYSEEQAFWMFVAIVENVLPPGYYTQNMIGIQTDCYVFKKFLKKKCSKLYSHFKLLSIDITPAIFPWFLSLFIRSLPIETVVRIFDCLVFEGNKTIFRCGLALFKIYERVIMELKETGEVYKYLNCIGADCFDCDKLIQTAFKTIRYISREGIEKSRQKQRVAVEEQLKSYQKRREDSAKGSRENSRNGKQEEDK